jgi:hypothetical protein
MGGDRGRHPAGMFNVCAPEAGYTISEDARREVIGVPRGEHDGRTGRPAEQAAIIAERLSSKRDRSSRDP